MKIRVFGQSGEFSFPFEDSGPWYEFKNTLISNGNVVLEKEDKSRPDAVIANSHNRKIAWYMFKNRIPTEKRVLVVWEPKVVDETRYRSRTLRKYGKVYAPSHYWSKELNAESFNWPQDPIIFGDQLDNWLNRKNRAILVQGNKYSARKGELYSLRREILKYDDRGVIDLFGTNWNQGILFDLRSWLKSALRTKASKLSLKSTIYMGEKFRNFKGSIENKAEQMRLYRIAIVVENSSDFVSEKLFDAVRSGCIAIYVGPELADFGIDNTEIFQVNESKESVTNRLSFLMNMPVVEQQELAKCQIKTLSQNSEEWENSLVLKKLAISISNFINEK